MSALFEPFSHAGSDVYVDDDAAPGGNGTSWNEAFRYLADALASIEVRFDTVQVKVAQGTYRPDRNQVHPDGTRNRNTSFIIPGDVRVTGGYAGVLADDPDEHDPARFLTVLSGDLNSDDLPGFLNRSDNSYHVVYANQTSGRLRWLGHCIIQGGNANGGGELNKGGGVYNRITPLHLGDCTIRDNEAGFGGGVYITPGTPFSGYTMSDSRFIANRASIGGGMYHSRVQFRVITCTFEQNQALIGGGLATDVDGGHFVLSCVFTDNYATYSGGGMVTMGDGLAKVRHCSFIRNRANSDGGAVAVTSKTGLMSCRFLGNSTNSFGGAVSTSGFAPAAIAGSVFVGNRAPAKGGAIHSACLDELAIGNCTMIANSSAAGGALFVNAGQVNVSNSIFWDNDVDQVGTALGTVARIVGSDVQGGWTGLGWRNIDRDPLLVTAPSPGADAVWGTTDDVYGDLRLMTSSPCVDAGLNNCASTDFTDYDEDSDYGEFYYRDLDTTTRFKTAAIRDDAGCDSGPVIDMGAHEHPGTGSQPRRGDVNGDLHVNGLDLAIILGAWGMTAEACLPPDVTCDGQVDGRDIAVVLGQWAP